MELMEGVQRPHVIAVASRVGLRYTSDCRILLRHSVDMTLVNSMSKGLVYRDAPAARNVRRRGGRRPPTPRQDVFDLYWYFACERQAIFERRVQGIRAPWTGDSILATFKFCNAYRAADRVSQFLIREVAYGGDDGATDLDRVFRIVAFRTFSRPETWRSITSYLGRQPTLADLKRDSFRLALDHARDETGGLYTGAFILCATDAYGQKRKHHNHVELFRDMFLRRSAAQRILEAKSLRTVFELLHEFPLMGDFMSYQTAIDLNYSAALSFDENEFTVAGPGSLRGLRKAFEDFGDYSPEDIILWMVERQAAEFARLGLDFKGLWGRPLHAIDCQSLFCELDKYCREALPQLTSARKRIKARFAPHAEAVQLFFPPKWHLNHLLPKDPVFGVERQGVLFGT
jgi:5-hmdU DNA kinase-like protein